MNASVRALRGDQTGEVSGLVLANRVPDTSQ
jgi:hypothetical protein